MSMTDKLWLSADTRSFILSPKSKGKNMQSYRLKIQGLITMFALLVSLLTPASHVVAQVEDTSVAPEKYKLYLPVVSAPATLLTSEQIEKATAISNMNQVAVDASTQEIVQAASQGEVFSSSRVFKLENCTSEGPCYIVATLDNTPDLSGDAIRSASMSGTLTCSWDIIWANSVLLARMKLNASGTFSNNKLTTPIRWSSGNQGGTQNVLFGATWSELSGVSFNPSMGTLSGNSASAWAQAKLNVSAIGITIIDRVLAQTLNLTSSNALCSHSGW